MCKNRSFAKKKHNTIIDRFFGERRGGEKSKLKLKKLAIMPNEHKRKGFQGLRIGRHIKIGT